jgi:hypothetical protein
MKRIGQQDTQEGAHQGLADQSPSSDGGKCSEPMVTTMPITAATIPNAGRLSANAPTLCDACISSLVVRLDLNVHQVLDFHCVEVSPHHQAQVIGDEFNEVMMAV